MIKLAYVLILACVHDGQLSFSRSGGGDTLEQCQYRAHRQIDLWLSTGIPLDQMNYDCIQVVQHLEGTNG